MAEFLEKIEKKSIDFENGRSAELLYLQQPIAAPEIVRELDIGDAKSAFLICPSTTPFKPRLKNRLLDLLSRGLAQAAVTHDAVILDAGAKDGVCELIGQGVADRGRKTPLIGIFSKKMTEQGTTFTSEDFKDRDQNHTHFVVNGEQQQGWQIESMCQLAETITVGDAKTKKRILTFLVGGELQGDALEMSLASVRRQWPLVVIEGSGPLADKIVRFKRAGLLENLFNRRNWANRLSRLQSTDPRLFEIISDGDIRIISKDADANQLRKLIEGLFTDPHKEDILWVAWRRFAEYDLNSVRHRNQWHWLKNWPLFLGVFSTLIVLIYSATDTNLAIEGAQSSIWLVAYSEFMKWLSGIKDNPLLDLIFRFTIIILPIGTSLLLAIETRLKLGSKYFLLRGAAEAVKRGIYSFRTLNKLDETKITNIRLPHTKKDLAEHLTRISKLLLESDVNDAAFKPYEGSIPPNMYGADEYDDGFSTLDPETYVKIRIGDQLKFYTLRTNQYEKRIRGLQIWILIWGAVGTFLAAIGAQYWLPFTATIVSAMTAFLEYRQLEQILTKYNLTKSSLENVRANWLSQPDHKSSESIKNLVLEVEAILESENQGWVQYISQAQERKDADSESDNETPQVNGENAD